jgi:hypothetical protein
VAGRFGSASLLLLTAWSLVGCYAYVPVAGVRAAVPASAVRVTLNAAGSEYLTKSLGNNVREIEGTVTRINADTIVLAVEQTTTTTRERFVSQGDTVAVPTRLAESVAVREYSKKKSTLVVLSIATALVLALVGVTNGASTSGTGQPGTVQP